MFADLKEKVLSRFGADARAQAGEQAGGAGRFGPIAEKLAGIEKKRIYTAAVALVVAGAAGHIMQRGAAPMPSGPIMAASIPAVSVEAEAAPVEAEQASARDIEAPTIEVTRAASDPVTMAPEPGPAPVADAIVDVSATVSEPDPAQAAPIVLAALEPMAPPMVVAEVVAEPELPACGVKLVARPMPGALVQLSLLAPCHSGEEVDFNHEGLRFSEQLGPDGALELMVPAMTQTARIVARLTDGQTATAEAKVPDIDAFERVALVWQGATGLQLHALENGATYGETGHVWAETPSMPAAAVEGTGGFVTVLGSTADGYAADVYTYPAGLAGTQPDVSIEAQVMENTCDGKIAGLILRRENGAGPQETPLSIATPGCDAIGEYLVLKNLPQSLKIARN